MNFDIFPSETIQSKVNFQHFFHRTMFYTSLGRLLMVDLGEDEDKFDSFMMPITNSFETLAQHLMNTNSSKRLLSNWFSHAS